MYIINAIVEAVVNHKSHIVIYRKWQNISLIDELQKSLDVEFTKIFDNGYKIHGWTLLNFRVTLYELLFFLFFNYKLTLA